MTSIVSTPLLIASIPAILVLMALCAGSLYDVLFGGKSVWPLVLHTAMLFAMVYWLVSILNRLQELGG